MTLAQVIGRIRAYEARRLARWIGLMLFFWFFLWAVAWFLVGRRSDRLPLEDQPEVIEAFADIYPLAL